MLNKFTGRNDELTTVKNNVINVRVNPAAPTYYNGDKGFEYLEGFPDCSNPKVHNYVLLALKHLLRLGKKDDIRTDLKKAITYLARAYYCVNPSDFKPSDVTDSFKDWV